MIRALVLLVIVCAMAHRAIAADSWKPAKSPLMTRWAKDVSPANVHPEYPRPQMVRKEWMNLNGLWEFATADEVKELPAGRTLPQRILVPFCMESALSGIGKHADRSWYRRKFEVPAGWHERVMLNFGAVDYECIVYINGKEVGTHKGGYDAFSFDITEALNNHGQQELIVGVTDLTAETQARGKQINNPNGIFYTPCSGIWQTVWIEPVPAAGIRSLKIMTDVDAGMVTVEVHSRQNPAAKVKVLDGDAVIAEGIEANGIRIPKPRFWSPDDPFLYRLRIAAGDDEVESYFAMRKISVASDGKFQRIMLNNQPITMVGTLDQGFWPDGIYTAPTDEALKFDIEQTKKLGFNTIRKHVKIEPQRFYYWCDKLGILVWQDMPSMASKGDAPSHKQFAAELQALIEQHRNSPSIIMWVPFNEGWGQFDTQRLTNWVKQLDPTRLVNNASGWTDAGAGDVHDIHAYPGPAAPKPEQSRAMVLGEFGGLGLGVDGHTWSEKAWGYQGMQSQNELTERYARLLGRLWQLSEDAGLCGGIYTQITDVETECNGLYTYDREVLKVDAEKVRQANLGKGPRVNLVAVVPTAQSSEPATWRYTLEAPAKAWEQPAFDDSQWQSGAAGFGTPGTPGAIVNTTWSSADIWIRREFNLDEMNKPDLRLCVHHDEDCEIYLNGVLASKGKNFTTDYVEQRIRDDALKTLRPGKNTLAVHCRQTVGGQYIDVGLVRLVEREGK